MPDKLPYKRIHKLILLCNRGVGKERIITEFLMGVFSSNVKGAQYYLKDIKIKGFGVVRLEITDFGGEESFKYLLKGNVKGNNGVLFFFSLTNPKTLIGIEEWINIVKLEDPEIPIILIGVHTEIEQKITIEVEECHEIMKKNGLNGYIALSVEDDRKAEESIKQIVLNLGDYKEILDDKILEEKEKEEEMTFESLEEEFLGLIGEKPDRPIKADISKSLQTKQKVPILGKSSIPITQMEQQNIENKEEHRGKGPFSWLLRLIKKNKKK